MKDDPIIADIRKVRHQISVSVDHDPRKLVEYYKQLQERHSDRVASLETSSSHAGNRVEINPDP